jgi:hypothetical protein
MIKIYSTFSRDVILDENKNQIAIRKKGPAFFIEKVLKKHKIKYEMNSGDVFKVEITLTKKGERGKIKKGVKRIGEIKNIKSNDFVIISTIAKEWTFGSNISRKAKIFLDIQGYMRTENQNDFFDRDFLDKILCLKGTKEEVKRLPKKIIINQKKKCLVITKGKSGSVIYFKKKRYIFHPKKIEVEDAIGAGDIFFASFIVKFIETNNITISGTFATKETENFLIGKTINKKL